MRTIAFSIAVLLAACSAAPGSSPTTAPEPETTTSTVPADPTTTSSTSSTVNANPSSTSAQGGAQPAYDVFLAAVAEAVEGTRYSDTPFESPEVVVSTGLALCEAIAEDRDPDIVVFQYLSDLVGGSPDEADDDQLVLVGALIGAAETALCPDDA